VSFSHQTENCQGDDMKKSNLVVGSIFVWFGADKLTADSPDKAGWVLLIVGIIIALSAFSSNGGGSGKGGHGGSTWDGSDGGDFGGGD
jgi:hypothetical protein